MSFFEKIEDYAKNKPLRFHMPGHKGKMPFGLGYLDITELDFTEQAIQKAQSNAATFFGVANVFFVTNGSSGGILSALLSLDRGSKVIVPRFSHKAVFNACALGGLQPIIVHQSLVEGIPSQTEPQQIEMLLEEHPNVSAVMVLYPDYYGRICDLMQIRAIVDRHNQQNKASTILICDSAHGAHFAISPLFPPAPSKIADITIMSGHKTLSVLTQSAYLTVNREDLAQKVKKRLSQLSSTSPSYLLLGSLDYGIELAKKSETHYQNLRELIEKNVERLPFFIKTHDFTRLCFDCKIASVDSEWAVKRLRKFSIEPEFYNARHIVFIITASDSLNDVQKLFDALSEISLTKSDTDNDLLWSPKEPPAQMTSFLEATDCPTEYVDILHSVGRICAVEAGFFPPCTPIIIRGELITETIASALNKKRGVFGVNEGKIEVLK